MTTKPIVVGVDGSRYGIAALRWSLHEARRRHCPVRAVTSVPTESGALSGRPTLLSMVTVVERDTSTVPAGTLRDALRAVEAAAEGVTIVVGAYHGSPAKALVESSADAQLLVLGSHGRSKLAEAIPGHVTRYCARNAECPVVVIPAAMAARESLPVPVVKPRAVSETGGGFWTGPIL